MDQALLAAVSKEGDRAAAAVDKLRNRYGIDVLLKQAGKIAEGGGVKDARGLVEDMTELTRESILALEDRGYRLDQVKEEYGTALSTMPADAESFEAIGQIASATGKAWGRIADTVFEQAKDKALGTITHPKPLWTTDDEITQEMNRVWLKSSERVLAGGRLEDLRSSLGLRTLAALETRFRHQDAEGKNEALPKAYEWARRAYDRTKVGIKHLAGMYADSKGPLNIIGDEYEKHLGRTDLARDTVYPTLSGLEPWDVIWTTVAHTKNAWEEAKRIIGKV